MGVVVLVVAVVQLEIEVNGNHQDGDLHQDITDGHLLREDRGVPHLVVDHDLLGLCQDEGEAQYQVDPALLHRRQEKDLHLRVEKGEDTVNHLQTRIKRFC